MGSIQVSLEDPSVCAPPIGSELELVLEVVATSISLIINLGPHIRLLGESLEYVIEDRC